MRVAARPTARLTAAVKVDLEVVVDSEAMTTSNVSDKGADVVVDLAMAEVEAVAVVDSEAAVEVRQNGKTLYYLLSKGLNLRPPNFCGLLRKLELYKTSKFYRNC